MKIYKSCDTLPIYNFNKIIETNNLSYLLKEIDMENDTVKVSHSEEMILHVVFKEIMDEYVFLTSDHNLVRKIKAQFSIRFMEIKIEVIEGLLDIFTKFGTSTHLVLLNKLGLTYDISGNPRGFRFDEGGNTDMQVKSIKSKLNGLKTKLAVKTNQYKKKYESDPETEQSISLEETAINVSRTLELGYGISVEKTSVAKWVGYLNLCKKTKTDG